VTALTGRTWWLPNRYLKAPAMRMIQRNARFTPELLID
jgi:hypothetical protein